MNTFKVGDYVVVKDDLHYFVGMEEFWQSRNIRPGGYKVIEINEPEGAICIFNEKIGPHWYDITRFELIKPSTSTHLPEFLW